ncbi:MAG: hypothetical protein ABSG84_13655 [Acidobacteriaceae bacterium]|jgi:hypothetical protein
MAEERIATRRRRGGLILLPLIISFWIGAGFDRQFAPNHIRLMVEKYSSQIAISPKINDSIDWVNYDGSADTVGFTTNSPCAGGGSGSNCVVNVSKGAFEYNCSTYPCIDPGLDVGGFSGFQGKHPLSASGSKDLVLDLEAPITDAGIMFRDLFGTASTPSLNRSSTPAPAPLATTPKTLSLSCSNGTMAVSPSDANPNNYTVPTGTTVLVWKGGTMDFSISSTTSFCNEGLPISSGGDSVAGCTLNNNAKGTVPYTVTVTTNPLPTGCPQSQTFNLVFP